MTQGLLATAREPTATTRRFVVAVTAVVVLVRVYYIFGPLGPDEAGYLLVARDWHLGGPNLYGHYWVDRPPGLIAIFKLASMVGWDHMVRALAVPFAALFVVGAAWAGGEVAGARAARWSALVGAALMITPAVGADATDGELFAAPLVMLSVALTLRAVRRESRSAVGHAFLAGLAGGLAVMVKQNFGDGVIFAVALLVVSLVQRRMSSLQAARIAVGGVVGGSVVLGVALAYARISGVGVAELWYDLFGFRSIAFDVIEDHSLHAPLLRAAHLLGLGVLSGLLPVLVALAAGAWRSRFTGSPIAWAVAVTTVTEAVGIVAGGSYWPHYLLQFAPMVAVSVGLWARDSKWLRVTAAWVVVSALVCTAVVVGSGMPLRAHSSAQRVGDWVRASGRPGDTATVLFGNADAQEATGMGSPYPYLWTLPMRTLDPHLKQLRSLVTGEDAPTWVVVWEHLDPWNIDPHDKLRLDIATHYTLVRHLCGREIWLRRGVTRNLAPHPGC